MVTDRALIFWVVYLGPLDHPGMLVVRPWFVVAGQADPVPGTAAVAPPSELERLRDELSRRGHVRLEREPGDDPAILETWV